MQRNSHGTPMPDSGHALYIDLDQRERRERPIDEVATWLPGKRFSECLEGRWGKGYPDGSCIYLMGKNEDGQVGWAMQMRRSDFEDLLAQCRPLTVLLLEHGEGWQKEMVQRAMGRATWDTSSGIGPSKSGDAPTKTR